MVAVVFRSRLLAVLVGLLITVFCAACGDDQTTSPLPISDAATTPVPIPADSATLATQTLPPNTIPAPTSTSTPQPTAILVPMPAPVLAETPIPAPTATPTPTLGPVLPTATPSPAQLGVGGFLQRCEAKIGPLTATLEAAFETADVTGAAGVEDITWGELAVLTGTLLTAYGALEPPPELSEYHDANLRTFRAFNQSALAHPSEDSFIEDFAVLIVELIGVAFEIGFDESMSEAQKDKQTDEILEEKFGEFFGPEFLEAAEAVDEAKAALSEETLALVEASACYSDTVSSVEGQGTNSGTAVEEDDHANSKAEATLVAIDSVVEGALDYEGDVDFFVFVAEGGKSYQIQVDVGSLSHHVTTLYDSDGEFLSVSATTNARSGRPFSRFLDAEKSGSYYVAVDGGLDNATGYYTLKVAQSIMETSVALPTPVPPEKPTPTPQPTSTPTPTTTPAPALSDDRTALVALYNATDGPNWANNDNWLSDTPIGEWHGVFTDADGRVIELELSDNQLVGHIPPELGNLISLTRLAFWNNRLRGEIPLELTRLAGLAQAYLDDNQLSGEIPPKLGNLVNLTELYLGGNQLSGEIPPELGNLTKLQWLSLGPNSLSGEIPPELGRLANLIALTLLENQLTGEIPPELGHLANLETLYLGGNHLTGCIPQGWRDISGDLTDLGLPFCSPAATSTDAAASDRVALVALYNATDGPNWANNDNWLSEEPIGEWHGVYIDDNGRVIGLNLYDNRLAGEIPPELGSLSHLKALQLGKNNLTGNIPASLGQLHNLWQLSLGGNQLEGSIPSELSSLRSLGNLTLEQNNLTGGIPLWLGGLTNLEELALGGNQLEGSIPDELADLSYLTTLALEGNRLTGSVPAWLGSLTNLNVLFLGDNRLEGTIPPELGNLTDLTWLGLESNNLTGTIPDNLDKLTNLKLLTVADNNLTGTIPGSLDGLTDLQHLFLQGNQLSGCIPRGLRNQLNMEASNLGGLPFC